MKGIAWDDKPKEYFEPLSEYLADYGIELDIYSSESQFRKAFGEAKHSYDFILMDLVRENAPAMHEQTITGNKLLQSIANEVYESKQGKIMPVFMLTGHIDLITNEDLDLPFNITIKSKSTAVDWMAADIYQELKAKGVYVNTKKVFLIYGHDEGAQGTSSDIEKFLQEADLEVVKIDLSNLTTEILHGIVHKMNECAAIIAVCTPDDELVNGSFVPRGNVLAEIGIALGLNRGLKRLIIVQRWGKDVRNQAILPTDFGGIVTLRFEGSIEKEFDKLAATLKKRGITINTN